MNSPEFSPADTKLTENTLVFEVADCIESVIKRGVPAQPEGRTRKSAWARDFYGGLRDEIATKMIDGSSLAEISTQNQTVTVGELAETMSIVATRYSKRTSPNPSDSQRGICITWGYESLENNQTSYSQTLVQAGSRTEGWQEIPVVNMPQVVAEFKTVKVVAGNDQEVGLQKEIPGWVKIVGGVGATAAAATVVAIGAKFAYGKLKNK